MYINIKEGERVGCLSVTSIKPERMTSKVGAITTSFESTILRMTCDCGKEVAIPLAQYPGKRKMRDCGCGKAADDFLPKQMLTVYVPSTMIARVDEWAEAHGMSRSASIALLCNFAIGNYPESD